MQTGIDRLTREKAAELLAQFREMQAQGRIVDALLIDGSDWEHPRTRELSQRITAVESCIESLLTSRARP